MSTIPQFDPPVATEITTIEDAVHHNARLPIHNLPTDIFTQCLPLFIINSYPYYVPCPKEWASVCKFWRAVIFSTPHLWSIVSSKMSPVDVHMALKISRKAALDVYIEDHFRYDGLWGYIENVVVQSFRWRSFSMGYTQYDEVDFPQNIASCLASPTPALRSIEIEWNGRPTTIALNDGPPLRTVFLENIALPWDSPRLVGLTHLTLWILDSSYAPTLIQMIRIIEGCSPTLVYLKLGYIEPGNHEQPLFRSWRQIELPHLHSLHLFPLSKAMTTALLAHIRAPHCKSVLWEMLSHFIRWNPAIPGFPSDMNRILRREPLVQVVVSEVGVRVSTEEHGAQEHGLWVEGAGMWRDSRRIHVLADVGRWLDACSDAAVVQLHLQCGPPTCLDVFSIATRLKISCDELPTILQHLGQPLPLSSLVATAAASGGASEWPCTRLAVLDLSGAAGRGYTRDEIREWVKGRWVRRDADTSSWPLNGEDLVEVWMPLDSMDALIQERGVDSPEMWKRV